MKVAEDILDTIGNTPLLKLSKISREAGISAEIYAKLEFYNPSGSLKDRIYREMIQAAINRGELRPGMEILEVSTGNAGIACSFRGHPPRLQGHDSDAGGHERGEETAD
jgi:cysteine synthase